MKKCLDKGNGIKYILTILTIFTRFNMAVKTFKKKKIKQIDFKTEWQLQEAKAMFSEVIKSALKRPQIITVHGKKTAVILSYEEYEDLTVPKQNLYELMQNSPFRDVVLELPERGRIEKQRDLNL